MTHDELLEKVYLYCMYANDPEFYGLSGYRKVLLTAMELHKPVTTTIGSFCKACGITSDYPCEIIQAIEKELG